MHIMYLHFEFTGNIGKTYSTIMFSVKTIAYQVLLRRNIFNPFNF